MDILNWLFTQDQQLIKSTINNKNTDLIAMAADVSFDKRQDKWQTYAMTAKGFAPALYDTADVTQITSTTTAVTVNAHTGVITTFTQTLNGGLELAFTVNNSKVTTNSKIFLQVQYANAATGIPSAHVSSISAGSFVIDLLNAAATGTLLNDVVKIHYMIID
jgi:hypothetical protein